MSSSLALPPHLEKFYGDFWGSRWDPLRQAITSETSRKVIWQNPWATDLSEQPNPSSEIPRQSAKESHSKLMFDAVSNWNLVNCKAHDSTPLGPIPRNEASGLLRFYVLDPGSVLIAQILPLEGEQTLDMCAAPGGKTLVLFSRLSEEQSLVSNEPSVARREQLIRTLRQYIPELPRQRLRVSGKPGGLFAKSHPEFFDSILVDAPCSGERYLFKNTSLLKEWSPRYSERLAQNQYALLTAAFHALKAGGYLLFSTCSISPLEGDQVVKRLLEKKGSIRVISEAFQKYSEIEPTSVGGAYILPDRTGCGPFYACLLQKI